MKSWLVSLLGAALAITTVPMVAGADVFYGLNYGVDQNNCPSLEQMKKDLTAIKKYSNRVRTFSLHICNQADLALQATQELGMQLYLGMWLDRQDTFDLEIQALKQVLAKYDFSNVDAIIAGSEVLYRKDTDANTLANWVKEVKQLVQSKGVKVTNADTFNVLSKTVIDQVDFVSMNAFPFWEGVSINVAGQTLAEHYDMVKGMSDGKRVVITETGWPSSGDLLGHELGPADPSIENQNEFISQVLCWTRKNNVDMLYFSAFEEPYKPGVEGHFGVMEPNGELKKGINLNPTC